MRIGITGVPRAGTSLAVKTIGDLGYKIYGEKEVKSSPKKYNPDGYWELEDVDLFDISNRWTKEKKGVIKVLLPYLDIFPCDKYIFCVRDLEDAAQSYSKLGLSIETARFVVDSFYSLTWEAMKDKDYIIALFNELKAHPDEWKKRIAGFVKEEKCLQDV